MVDGKEREYFIHLPDSYDGTKPFPLVFMLHGTSGDGEVFYNAYGWKELSETENFIPVFPSSGRYKIIDDGENKTTTKWNTVPDANWQFQPGEKGLDDIKFLRKVIEEMKMSYNIDSKRIYLNGFSNGGAMAAKCAVEMSDVFAAVAENAGSFFLDTVYIPKRKLPVLYQVGNQDYGPGNEGPEVPLSMLDTLISTPGIAFQGGKHYRIAANHINNFNLHPEHDVMGDTSFAVQALYQPVEPGPGTGYEFRFVLVKGLAHNYPNGNNHPFNAPRVHWNWMKQFVLENAGSAQNLDVTQGYGSGSYSQGDKVHIWSRQEDGKVFTHWSGDVQYLDAPEEYHTIVTMPEGNVSVTANYATLTQAMKLTQVTVQGAQRPKKIYTYLPPIERVKGVVWFFHGTNGNAASMAFTIDTKQYIDLLMSRDFGVVVITSEESEFDIDFNNDGVYRWSYGLDSTLVDIANVRAIRDSIINRGLIGSSTRHHAFGYSAGGAFTEFIANVLGWETAINHNSPGNETISMFSTIPYLAAISENDLNPGVGPAGNAQARQNILNYQSRNACAMLHEHKASPLYPERFDRSSFITEATSKLIFNEMKANDLLDSDNYLLYSYDQIEAIVLSNPVKFPLVRNLSPGQLNDIKNEISVCHAEHNVKADINGLIYKFMTEACGNTTDVAETEVEPSGLKVTPNPAMDFITLNAEGNWTIYDLQGRKIATGNQSLIRTDFLLPGLYIISCGAANARFLKY